MNKVIDLYSSGNSNQCELSVVIPCLNEADTLESCLRKVLQVLNENNISGEIIVADNGSNDGSTQIAKSLGVKVIDVNVKGYGSALMGGINVTKGKFIIMGDADASYDFAEIPSFLQKLREGFDIVMGCRLPMGGGRIMKNAMPILHRWIGNPLFSWMVRKWFAVKINDVHCGMRGFKKDFYSKLNLKCTGMEFASEMIIKASYLTKNICEVPITLHKDGRKSHKRHLRTFRDGWRHLRFYLIYSPRWLFLYPGIALITIGIIGYGFVIPAYELFGRIFDVHTLLFASLFILCGYQSVIYAFLAKTYAINEGLRPKDKFMTKVWEFITLEKGIFFGIAMMFVGLILLTVAIYQWKVVNFGALDYRSTMRWVIPGVTLTTIGFQTMLFSFFSSILGLQKQ